MFEITFKPPTKKLHAIFPTLLFLHLSPIEVETGAVLPLWMLNTDPAYEDPQDADTQVRCLYHCYRDLTIDVAAYPVVRLPPLGGEMTGNPLQGGFCLCA